MNVLNDVVNPVTYIEKAHFWHYHHVNAKKIRFCLHIAYLVYRFSVFLYIK